MLWSVSIINCTWVVMPSLLNYNYIYNYMVSLLLASSKSPILVISENADVISNYFLVWIYALATLCVFYFVYMVSPLSRSVSVINCPRVELSSLFNHMVSLLLASSNSPILVNSEGFYPIIFLYGFILYFTMTVSVLYGLSPLHLQFWFSWKGPR